MRKCSPDDQRLYYIQAEGSVSESEGTWNNLALISDSAQTSTYKKVRSRKVKVNEG